MGRKGPNPSNKRAQSLPRPEFVRPRQGAGMTLRANELNLIRAMALAFAAALLMTPDASWRRHAV